LEDYRQNFIKGLNIITGISEEKLQDYASNNNVFNVLEHPNTINPDKEQLNRIRLLNDFLISYRLLKLDERDAKITLNTAQKSGDYFLSLLSGIKDRERFLVTFLDRSNTIIETKVMAEGDIGESAVYPRMVLKAAMDCDCSAIILSHNHPTGNVKPSAQDLAVTGVLVSIFNPIGINVLDHIVVGDTDYYSMTAHGEVPKPSKRLVNYDAIIYTEKPDTHQPSLESLICEKGAGKREDEFR